MTHPPYHPTWIEIDLSQFRKNLATFKNWISPALYCLPVKANAYGHGLIEMGREAEKVGIDYLAVAHLSEGVKLREAGITMPILVLGAFHEDQVDTFPQFNLEFTISSQYKAELVEKHRPPTRCRVHLEIDTGMRRTGVRPESAKNLLRYLLHSDAFEVVGVYSHFASAKGPDDPTTQGQIASFEALLQDPLFQTTPPLLSHICNSAGAIFFPQAHHHMVRSGVASFGYLPPHTPPPLHPIAPCFSLKTRVSYFKVVPPGEGISYGHLYKTAQTTRIITLPIGYGDGLRRSLAQGGSVLIRGKRFPIAGAICMDQLMVDVGDQEVFVGEEAVLIGRQGEEEISVREVASLCQTIPYEILCSFNERIPRVHKG